MASNYPGSLDTFATNKEDDTHAQTGADGGISTSVGDHATHHNDLADAVNKIEAELGTSPKGGSATVSARLALLATLASPTFTGTPTLPTGTIGVTQSPGNNTTAVSTTAFVTAVEALVVKLAGSQTITGAKTLTGVNTHTYVNHAVATFSGTATVNAATMNVYTGTGGHTATLSSSVNTRTIIANQGSGNLTVQIAGGSATINGSVPQTLEPGWTLEVHQWTSLLATGRFAPHTNLSTKADLASPTFTGTPTLPTGTIGVTQTAGNSTTALATTAFVTTADSLKANLASPTFTGTVSLGALTGSAGAVNLTGSTTVTVPTVTIGAGSNAATIGAVNTALGAYLTTSAASSTYQPIDSDLTAIAGLTATTDNIIQSKAGAWSSRTPAQFKTDLVLVKGDVGLGSVDNTSDAGKPVSTAQQTALDLKANLASPTFTGTPTLPTGTIGVTQTAGNSTTALATTAFATTALNLKADLASPTFTGTPTLPTGTIGVTQTAGNSTTALATTAFATTALNLKADLASPTFTGTPTLPTGTIGVTQSPGNNTTAVSTTAFVTAAITAAGAPDAAPYTQTSSAATSITLSSVVTILSSTTNVAVTVPAAGSHGKKLLRVKAGNLASGQAVTLTPASGTIEGAASYAIDTPYGSADLVNDGTNWFVM